MKRLEQLHKKRITLEEIEQLYKVKQYEALYNKVIELIDKEYLKPVKASGLNGKYPALYKRYHICPQQEDLTHYLEELKYKLTPKIDITYYINHLEQYKKDREAVLKLDKYLKDNSQSTLPVSVNERSFEIWGREKFLKQEGGEALLKRVGLGLENLNVYETIVPIAYYTNTKVTPQNILVIENKDTFYSMRYHLMAGNESICGVPIGTLVYGGGKQIVSALRPFIALEEPYIQHVDNCWLYFGDLDYEGIAIYQGVRQQVGEDRDIKIFLPAYQAMLTKCKDKGQLPLTKEKQNRVVLDQFVKNFLPSEQQQIKEVLENNQYIPQEILNRLDF